MVFKMDKLVFTSHTLTIQVYQNYPSGKKKVFFTRGYNNYRKWMLRLMECFAYQIIGTSTLKTGGRVLWNGTERLPLVKAIGNRFSVA